MSNWYDKFIKEISIIVAKGVDGSPQLWREEQIRTRNIQNEIDAGKIRLPFCILSIPRLKSDREYMPSGVGFTTSPTITYIRSKDGTPTDANADTLEIMACLWSFICSVQYDMRECWIDLESAEIDASPSLESFDIIEYQNQNLVAAALTFEAKIGFDIGSNILYEQT
jgi:hypothetical protein